MTVVLAVYSTVCLVAAAVFYVAAHRLLSQARQINRAARTTQAKTAETLRKIADTQSVVEEWTP